MTFGEKLRDLRKEHKMSIKELASKSGITTVSISNYENDHCIPNLITIQKLANALNCNYDTLYNLR